MATTADRSRSFTSMDGSGGRCEQAVSPSAVGGAAPPAWKSMADPLTSVGYDRPQLVHPLAARSVDPEVATALAAIPGLSGSCSDVLDELGYRLVVPAAVLGPLSPDVVVIGRAVTIRYVPSRLRDGDGKLAHLTAAQLGRPGDVLVISAPAVPHSVLGGQAARALRSVGIAGVVVDGFIRDLDEVAASGLPIWFRGSTAISGRRRVDVAEINGAVEIAGITVLAGDVIVADRSGIAVVPTELFERFAERLLAAIGKAGRPSPPSGS